MSAQLILLLITASIASVFGFFFIHYGKGSIIRRNPNYLAFFILGLIWVIIGLILSVPLITILGFLLTIIGAIQKKHWKDKKELSKSEKRMRRAAIICLLISLIIGITGLILRPGI